MNERHDHDDNSLDDALHQQWQDGAEPDDAGFSLRVMAALSPAVAPSQRRWVRRVRLAQWVALSLAACGIAVLLAGGAGPLDTPHTLAALALMGLLIFWSIPSRWNRG